MDMNAIWFWLLGFLFIGYALLDGFDLGLGIIHLFTRDLEQRLLHFRSIKPVWDGNEVWLIVGGASLFAAFPPVYAAVFSGFYLAFFLLLLALIFRGVSIEFVEKVHSGRWRRSWDRAFGLGSLVASLLFGVAVGNIVRGIPIDDEGFYAGTFIGLLNPFALLVGLLVVVMFIMHGAAWMAPKSDGLIQQRMRAWTIGAWVAFLPLHLATTAAAYTIRPQLFAGLYDKPAFWVLIVVLLLGAISLPFWILARRDGTAFTASSAIVASASALAGLGLFPVLVPSTLDSANTMTIYNASSSQLTLTVMFWIVAITMPFVLAYTAVVHWIFRGKVEAKGETLY